jgi:hypothetical protein
MKSNFLIKDLEIPVTEYIVEDTLNDISNLDVEEFDVLLNILNKKTSPKNIPDNILKVRMDLECYIPDLMKCFTQNNVEEFIDFPYEKYTPLERKKVFLELLLLEAKMKYRSVRIKQHFLEIGRDLYQMKNYFDESSDYRKFKEWYTSVGFKKDFVSLTLKKYDLYLLAIKVPYFKKIILYDVPLKEFFENLPVRAVKAISKKIIPDKQKIDYLIDLYKKNKTTMEIENEIKEINKTFNLTKYIKLVTKIDLHKKKYLPHEMKELLTSIESIENQLNKILEREKYAIKSININDEKLDVTSSYNNRIDYIDNE